MEKGEEHSALVVFRGESGGRGSAGSRGRRRGGNGNGLLLFGQGVDNGTTVVLVVEIAQCQRVDDEEQSQDECGFGQNTAGSFGSEEGFIAAAVGSEADTGALLEQNGDGDENGENDLDDHKGRCHVEPLFKLRR